MTLDLLSKTGIGKIVNRLCTNEKFGNKASKIVENWRNMARNTQKHRNNNEKTYSNETSNNKVFFIFFFLNILYFFLGKKFKA